MSARTVEEMKQPEDGAAAGVARVDRDAELVAALRRQDPTAPEALVTTFGDRVYRLAIRITGNEQDAEEVVQDALWTAARKIDTFKGESAFGSWLYRITANAAYQKLRSRQSKRQEISWEDLLPTFDEMGAHAEPVRDWSARAEEPALQTELRTVLTTAINDLPGDYRTAFLLHDVEGLSNPGDRRDAAHQPARGEVPRASLAAVSPQPAVRLSAAPALRVAAKARVRA